LRHFEVAVQAQQEDFALVFGQALQRGIARASTDSSCP